MNQKRHLENLKDMRNYLKSKGFLERNMKIFYANNRSIDRKFPFWIILYIDVCASLTSAGSRVLST